jgi:phosphonate transport system permease protein
VTSQLAERPTDPLAAHSPSTPRPVVSRMTVLRRRLIGVVLVLGPVGWALSRAGSGGTDLLNPGGVAVLLDLLGAVIDPAVSPEFLRVVGDAVLVTVVFAALGTAGALVLGAAGALVLAESTWRDRPPAWVLAVRAALRLVLVATRAVHELVWALLFLTVLGLDPVIGVLAIAVPFGAQTAKVFADILDGSPRGPLEALRRSGAPSLSAVGYGLLPPAAPLLVSYAFYRFECAVRAAVLLGVVGIGGLGAELVVSLRSRNWDEVWTLVAAVVVLSAVVDLWSSRLRTDLAVATCSDWSVGAVGGRAGRGGTRRARWSVLAAVALVAVSWWWSGVSLAGFTSPRARERAAELLAEAWPPALPGGGWSTLTDAVLDTLAMAVLAMVLAVLVTVLLAPGVTRPRPARGTRRGWAGRAARGGARAASRLVLLVLRSVPPTVWAALALLVLFPGVLPGAVALGLYTGGILGRLVAEAWDGIDLRPRDALRAAGVPPARAALTTVVPPSAQHLVSYTLYRFEICVRDTAVVGVVGAAGLGRLLAESLATFRYPVLTTTLLASFAVSAAAEVAGRLLRRALRR